MSHCQLPPAPEVNLAMSPPFCCRTIAHLKGCLSRSLKIHIGPVHPPAPIEDIYGAYRDWVTQINPNAYRPGDMPDPEDDDVDVDVENSASEDPDDE